MSALCRHCTVRKQNTFCNLPNEALDHLEKVKKQRTFAPGTRLFEEGQPVDELMIVCKGSATLTFSTLSGRTAMLCLSEPGEVLGISSAVSGHPHEVTADAVDQVQVTTISAADFRQLLDRVPSLAAAAREELSRKVNQAYDKIRLVGSGLSVPQRLAGWLLRLQDQHPDHPERVTMALTHERISQLLGVSRESITRALAILKRRGAVEVRGIHLYVRDHRYLKSLLNSWHDRELNV